MLSTEERLERLHGRADVLKKKRDMVRLRGMGGITGALAVCLVMLLAVHGRSGHDITETGYAATSMLSESAGGYVLVAIIAFAAGVVLTVLLKRRGRNSSRN